MQLIQCRRGRRGGDVDRMEKMLQGGRMRTGLRCMDGSRCHGVGEGGREALVLSVIGAVESVENLAQYLVTLPTENQRYYKRVFWATALVALGPYLPFLMELELANADRASIGSRWRTRGGE